ncbi:hypothetical protein Trydic_g7627 [Trypoxylus dichotomus]
MANICRLCLSNVLNSSIFVYNDTVSHETKIKFLIPEIDLGITPNFDLCYLCTHLLCVAYSFMRGCIQTENLIKEYILQNGTTMFNLENVKQFRKYKVPKIEDNLVEEANIKIEVDDEDIKTSINTLNTREVQSSRTCDECHITFKKEEFTKVHKEGYNLLKCSEYNKMCLTEDDLENQFKSDTIEILHTCEICKQSFKELSELKHHICKNHNGSSIVNNVDFRSPLRNRYTTDVPRKKVHSRSLFKIHNRANQEHKCSICSRTFKLRWILNKHVINHHQKPFVCEVCGIRCSANSILIEHMRVHTGERPFKCETCGKAFAQRSSLTVHIRCLHENIKRFVCEVCGKTFAVHSSLTKHMRVHTDPIEKTFRCTHEGCDKMFNTKRAVGKHMQRHVAIKRHKCILCDKVFVDTPALKRHMRTHTGEKPYACHICGKAFSQAYNLKVHFKSHRPKEKRST